jgi:nucleoside-diphosphate-sugar epimerase
MSRRILLTGHEGYLGSVMGPHLVEAGYDVVGLDTGYFHDCTLVPDRTSLQAIRKDLRDLAPDDLEGFYAVIHLGALSNDPIGNLRKDWTEQINHEASVRLASLAKAAGVERFLFSSSCIMYGMSEATLVNEDAPLDPKTVYAASKVQAERGISALAGDGFSPVFLRNGTVYGLSPRMRFDTVFNNLMGSAVTTGRVVLESDGKPWRPVIHVQDVARSFQAVLEAPVDVIHNQAFNNGADSLNYTIKELADIVLDVVPDSKLEIRAARSADQRTYKADFTKFTRSFPRFQFQWSAADGARELYEAFRRVRLSHAHYTDRHFTRLKWLNHLLESRLLDDTLRWSNGNTHR